MRLLFYVQTLLGMGHLQRVAALSQACSDLGHQVSVVSGGVVPEQLSFGTANVFQLPPCRAADATCKTLVHPDGTPVPEDFFDTRSAMLCTLAQEIKPQCVVTELFPFGRWRFRKELLPFFAALPEGTRIVASVRDIINQGSIHTDKAAKVRALIETHYTSILIHSDPDLLRLEDSYPPARNLPADKLIYTGYIKQGPGYDPHAAPAPSGTRTGVVISAGSGLYGLPLYEKALAAKPLSRYAEAPWTIVAGPYFPEQDWPPLQAAAEAQGVTALRRHPCLPDLFRTHAVSVSQAGYNTTLEVLTSGVAPVVIPFQEAKESEQRQRSLLLAEKGWLTCLDDGDLKPHSLAQAIDTAKAAPSPDIHCNGAFVSAAYLDKLLREIPV